MNDLAINRVTLVGRVAAPPTVKHLQSGKALTTIRVETRDTYKDRSGEQQERVEQHPVTLWGERTMSGVAVGTLVYVEGRLSSRSYEGRDGTRWATEMVGEKVVPLGGSSAPDARPAAPAPTSQPGGPLPGDEDIPF